MTINLTSRNDTLLVIIGRVITRLLDTSVTIS
jgi:hypothetical protein